jgi:hypothetical protein
MGSEFITDFSEKKTLEKYSSAFTLSDMEIFIFPDLFYPLILADIISPELWKWKEDPWFKDIEKKSFTTIANRIKQYIIQNYIFNLDLSTWGLTSRSAEIERFRDFFDMDLLKQSNALFGYEGDKYYFDLDIRKHFGLDKYDSDIIPYWKTETIEAMGAFRYKENFRSGAGECVSLSALYAAALFVVGKIPLEKIFLIATPLHSQNFIIEKDGLITNNRRIVTKNMWYNGTSLSEKARRALENEKVTVVSHISGYIHVIYEEATIEKEAYRLFSSKLEAFLTSELTPKILINFLRFRSKYKCLFQYMCDCSGKQRYILLDKMFEYEHTSKYNVGESRRMLVNEIEGDEFHLSPIQEMILLNDIEEILDGSKGKTLEEIENEVFSIIDFNFREIIHEMFLELQAFITINPQIPEFEKNYIDTPKLKISTGDSREKIISTITRMAEKSEQALLSLYVYRDMDKINWLPFIKAAIERNPVCFGDLNGKNIQEAFDILADMDRNSIYDGKRLAMPDEVWNFQRGDGIEKALLLAGFIMKKDKSTSISIDITNQNVQLSHNGSYYHFTSQKSMQKSIKISDRSYIIN